MNRNAQEADNAGPGDTWKDLGNAAVEFLTAPEGPDQVTKADAMGKACQAVPGTATQVVAAIDESSDPGAA